LYEYLDGEIAARSAARVVLDVGGIGFDVHVPLGAPFPASGRARVWTHLVIREDAHTLCGFPDRETRDLFRLLISVRGVGPVMALVILSGLPREPLLDAVANGDAGTLTKIRGVGKKTAEQILLDMREKAALLRAELANGSGARSRPATRGTATIEDAVQALVSIGYSEKEARKSVERAAQRVDAKNLELLVRTALTS
jgi:Holliday junction DNA helicase RuvA